MIGQSGSRIRTLIDLFGGPDKIKINFSKYGDDVVTITCHSKIISNVKASLMALVNEVLGGDQTMNTDNMVEDTVEIFKGDVARIVGRNAETLKGIQEKFGVNIFVGNSDKEQVIVHILDRRGSKDAIENAKAEILVCFLELGLICSLMQGHLRLLSCQKMYKLYLLLGT
jgi:predicted PilT family ATPase